MRNVNAPEACKNRLDNGLFAEGWLPICDGTIPGLAQASLCAAQIPGCRSSAISGDLLAD